MNAPKRNRSSDLGAGLAAVAAFLLFLVPLALAPWLSALLAGAVYVGVKLLTQATLPALPKAEHPAPEALLQELARLHRQIPQEGVRARIAAIGDQARRTEAYFQANPEAAGLWRGFFSECLSSTVQSLRRYLELARRVGEPEPAALQEFESLLDSLGITFRNLHQRLVEEDVASYSADLQALRSTVQALNDVSVLRVGGTPECKDE
jgi:hypothetical protein